MLWEPLSTLLSTSAPLEFLYTLCLVAQQISKLNDISALFERTSHFAPNTESLSLALVGDPDLLQSTWYTPLLRLHALTNLHLCADSLENADDACLAAIIKACPHLLRLRIRSVHPVAVSPKATLGTLAAIATHCPHIEHIVIRLDCASSYPKDARSWQGFGDSLRTLNMEMSKITKPAEVAGIMCHLFRVSTPRDFSEMPLFGGKRGLVRAPDEQARIAAAEMWDSVDSSLHEF